MAQCQYARCGNAAVFSFPQDVEAMYCHTHKADGMVDRLQNPSGGSSDYYSVLGITKDATAEQIKRAYHRESLRNHPDKNGSPEAAENFCKISEAYMCLSDPAKRKVYDTMGAEGT
jgi:hypothetical protein